MIEVLEKRISECHVDGEPASGRSGVIQEICIQSTSSGYRWLIRDSIRDGGQIGDAGEWMNSRAEALAEYRKVE